MERIGTSRNLTMDPYKSTREQFTNGLLDNLVPADASEEWKKYVRPFEENRVL